MINNIFDLDALILQHCDPNTLDNLLKLNKHYNRLSTMIKLNGLLKQFNREYYVKTIYDIVSGSSCNYCGEGHLVYYHVGFTKGYGVIDYFTGCLTFEEELNVSYFETKEKSDIYLKNNI
jgi:hypothetical protein